MRMVLMGVNLTFELTCSLSARGGGLHFEKGFGIIPPSLIKGV